LFSSLGFKKALGPSSSAAWEYPNCTFVQETEKTDELNQGYLGHSSSSLDQFLFGLPVCASLTMTLGK
jgi:hypothetical protein